MTKEMERPEALGILGFKPGETPNDEEVMRAAKREGIKVVLGGNGSNCKDGYYTKDYSDKIGRILDARKTCLKKENKGSNGGSGKSGVNASEYVIINPFAAFWTAATIGWMNVWINAYGGFYSRTGGGSGSAGQRGGGAGGKPV